MGVCVCVWYIVFCGCQCVRASVTRQRTQDMELTEFTCSSSDAWPPECMQCSKKENTHTHTYISVLYTYQPTTHSHVQKHRLCPLPSSLPSTAWKWRIHWGGVTKYAFTVQYILVIGSFNWRNSSILLNMQWLIKQEEFWGIIRDINNH